MKSTLYHISILITFLFLTSCSNGDSAIDQIKLIPVKNGTDYQYIDRDGKIVINPQFSEATIFRNGLSLVKATGDNPKWGFITEDGKYAIAASYKAATVFSDNLAWVVSENSPPSAIDNKGRIIFTAHQAEKVKIFRDGLAPFSIIDNDGEKWGFINTEGKVAINPQFKSTGRYSEGRCAVENDKGKWGFIDKEGKIMINYQFTKIGERFIKNRAVVYLDEKAGVIDESGKFVINPQFSTMFNDGDKYLIEQDKKWGWCDNEGKIIINPQFGAAYPFMGNNLAPVQSGKSWGYIDKDGKIIINPQFDLAFPHNGKLALITSGGKVGFIDAEGKYAINPQFDDASQDLLAYQLYDWAAFDSVSTDFFNIASIVNRINIISPEGLSLSNKLSDWVEKLKISENNFYNQFSDDYIFVRNEKISKDASMVFFIIADAYKEVPDGWYTKKEFNPDAIVKGFAYGISLRGKGAGKEQEVKNAIEKSFLRFNKDETQSTELMNVYKNDNQTIKSYISESQIIIGVMSNQNGYFENE